MTNKPLTQHELNQLELDYLCAEFGSCLNFGIQIGDEEAIKYGLDVRMSNLATRIRELLRLTGQYHEEEFRKKFEQAMLNLKR
jgi:hypothetical protein